MSELTITSTEDADPADVLAVRSGLGAYNDRQTGPARVRRVHLLVRDADGRIRGGLLGRQMWDWLYVEILWLDETLRGEGLGGSLLRQAEEEARQAGCRHAVLDTFSFQARPFYEKLGYTVFGTLEDFPEGFRRFYLHKRLE